MSEEKQEVEEQLEEEKTMATLTSYLSKEMKARFRQYCKRQHRTPSQQVAAFIDAALEEADVTERLAA